MTYANHIVGDPDTVVLEYLYFDFVQACLQVIAMPFPQSDKMERAMLRLN